MNNTDDKYKGYDMLIPYALNNDYALFGIGGVRCHHASNDVGCESSNRVALPVLFVCYDLDGHCFTYGSFILPWDMPTHMKDDMNEVEFTVEMERMMMDQHVVKYLVTRLLANLKVKVKQYKGVSAKRNRDLRMMDYCEKYLDENRNPDEYNIEVAPMYIHTAVEGTKYSNDYYSGVCSFGCVSSTPTAEEASIANTIGMYLVKPVDDAVILVDDYVTLVKRDITADLYTVVAGDDDGDFFLNVFWDSTTPQNDDTYEHIIKACDSFDAFLDYMDKNRFFPSNTLHNLRTYNMDDKVKVKDLRRFTFGETVLADVGHMCNLVH